MHSPRVRRRGEEPKGGSGQMISQWRNHGLGLGRPAFLSLARSSRLLATCPCTYHLISLNLFPQLLNEDISICPERLL